MRLYLVLAHRYAGLVMAGFLLIAGLTGALLAWYHPLDAALNPRLFQASAPAPQAPMLDPLVLRERVLAHYPGAEVQYVPLKRTPGEAVVFTLRGAGPSFEEAYFNPYSGALQGTRTWGDLSQGLTNLMPFVYRLHFSLALGDIGSFVFGIVALLWTLDCFIGAWLTFPARQGGRGWWRRWAKAWKVRRTGGAYKLNFDLHRAGGLWTWAILFVFAWSGVAFNLTDEVYAPAMNRLFAMQPSMYRSTPDLARPEPEPAMGWAAGLALGRRHMAALAREKGFVAGEEDAISYEPSKGFFRLTVRSDRDIRDKSGSTSVYFDARSGLVLGSQIPTGAAAGDTITMWILTLHIAQIWGWPFRVVVTLAGLVVALLSVTGVYLWWKKRRARLHAAPQRAQRSHGGNPGGFGA